jgi:HK97 family phage portal protein
MLSRLFTQGSTEERAQATVWGTWPGDSGSPSAPVVTQTSAMQLLAVSGCVRLITDSISTLPVDMYRELPDGTKEELDKPRWLKQPTVDLDFTAWCTQVLTSLLLHGNAYCAVTRNGAAIVELVPVDPSTIHVTRMKGRKVYIVAGREYTGELLHIKGMMLPGTEVGLSPLEYARQSISLGLSAIEYGSDQFGQALNMPGVIESPGKMLPEQMSAMAQAWRKARSKRGRGLPGVLEGGATWKPTGVTNEQAQFLQTRQWTAAEIAAQVFLVDPSDLGIPVGGTTLTYANLQERNLRRVQVTFLPWIIRLEAALSSLLPQPRYVKLNVNGLLRGDTSQRWSTYTAAMNINAIAAQVGQPPVMLTSEMREFEDLNVIDNDEPGAPADVPADTVEGTPVQMNASSPDVHVTVNIPESRTDAPVVNVTNEVRTPEPQVTVNVEPPGVVVDVQPQTINVPGAEVRMVEAEPKTTVRRVERDDHGRILRVIDEVG